MGDLKLNVENYKRVLDHIKAHPETWKQARWHCDTSHCFAGHAQIMAGQPADDTTVRRDARIFLNISWPFSQWLFAAHRTLSDFEGVLVLDRDGYDSDGYDRDGLDPQNKPRA